MVPECRGRVWPAQGRSRLQRAECSGEKRQHSYFSCFLSAIFFFPLNNLWILFLCGSHGGNNFSSTFLWSSTRLGTHGRAKRRFPTGCSTHRICVRHASVTGLRLRRLRTAAGPAPAPAGLQAAQEKTGLHRRPLPVHVPFPFRGLLLFPASALAHLDLMATPRSGALAQTQCLAAFGGALVAKPTQTF